MCILTLIQCICQRGCQTRAIHSAEAEVQTVSTASSFTQTEPQNHTIEQLLQQHLDQPDPPNLKDFLRRVEDTVIRELVRNAGSHAFDWFQVNWEDHNQPVKSRSVKSNVLSLYNYSKVFYTSALCHVRRFHAFIAFNTPAHRREVYT